MKRYFFYIVFINSINNIIIFLPRILLKDRYQGAIMAIIFALPYGTFFLYFSTKAMTKFPNKGFPEILKITIPRWAQISLMLFSCSLWYVSGIMMLTALMHMIQRFIAPYLPMLILLIPFVLIILFAIRTESSTVMYSLEIFMVLIVPMIIFIFVKAIISPLFNWDSCLEVVTHSFTFPTLSSYAVTTYMFSGYSDIFTFNRVFNKENFQLKHVWLFPVLVLVLLVFAFFIPIGLLGTEGVTLFNYPWIATTDCISIKTGLIERTMYVYLLVFLLTATINIIVHWHVSLELIKGIFQYQFNFKKIKTVAWYILGFFGVIPFILMMIFPNEQATFFAGGTWLSIRLFVEPLMAGVAILSAYIAKKKGIV